MEIKFERTDAAAIFILNGRIDSFGSSQLDNAIKTRITADDRIVIFDMAHVPYISSVGIRVFYAFEKMLHQKNRYQYLCTVQPEVKNILEITGFHRIFTLCSTTEEALNLSRTTDSPAGSRIK